MQCPQCGAEWPSEAKFCGTCGAQLPRMLRCGQCGAEWPGETKFCGRCGARLAAPSAAQPLDATVTPSAPLAAAPASPEPPPAATVLAGAQPSPTGPTPTVATPSFAPPTAPPPSAPRFDQPGPWTLPPAEPVPAASATARRASGGLWLIGGVVLGMGVVVAIVLALARWAPQFLPGARQRAQAPTAASPAVVIPSATLPPATVVPATLPPTAAPATQPALAAATLPVPSATAAAPTLTPVPPTATQLPPTATPPPPTLTPVPPTATLPPATLPPTPKPPSATPRPATATPPPPTAAPPAVTVSDSVAVQNGQWGAGVIWVEMKDGIELIGADGRKYGAGLGFLSGAASQNAIQDCWNRGARSGAAWKMRLVVRKQVGWVACPSTAAACYEKRSDTGGLLYSEVFIRPDVWIGLLNDYLARGVLGPTANASYAAIQEAVFKPVCGGKPNAPAVGFTFRRLD